LDIPAVKVKKTFKSSVCPTKRRYLASRRKSTKPLPILAGKSNTSFQFLKRDATSSNIKVRLNRRTMKPVINRYPISL